MSTAMHANYRMLATSILAIVISAAAVSSAAAAPTSMLGSGPSSAVSSIPIAGSIYDDADPTGIHYIRRLIHRPLTSPPESEREVVVSPRKSAMSHESRLSAFIEWIRENLVRRSRASR